MILPVLSISVSGAFSLLTKALGNLERWQSAWKIHLHCKSLSSAFSEVVFLGFCFLVFVFFLASLLFSQSSAASEDV